MEELDRIKMEERDKLIHFFSNIYNYCDSELLIDLEYVDYNNQLWTITLVFRWWKTAKEYILRDINI